jgi:predicted HNH restriction endonuclease
MSNIILETSSDISKITTGQELNLVADEFYTYCIRMKFDINEAERMNYSLTALVPSFLKSHGFKPDFDSIFMTCDKTYVNTIIHHIKHNSLFNLEDRHVGNVLSNSLKLYIKFLSSEFDPRSNVYKKKNEEEPDFSEGKVSESHCTKFERKKANRLACLSVHGYKCAVCGFDFEENYGEIGKEFIEVHHIIPLSQIRKEYIINPVKDLIPLCSNCHSMIHRKRDEAIPIKEFKRIYNQLHNL